MILYGQTVRCSHWHTHQRNSQTEMTSRSDRYLGEDEVRLLPLKDVIENHGRSDECTVEHADRGNRCSFSCACACYGPSSLLSSTMWDERESGNSPTSGTLVATLSDTMFPPACYQLLKKNTPKYPFSRPVAQGDLAPASFDSSASEVTGAATRLVKACRRAVHPQ